MDEPSTSKQAAAVQSNDDFELVNKMEEEEAEIARLEAEVQQDPKEAEYRKAASSREPLIKFMCSACEMDEMVHYFGTTPPFAFGISYVEDTYVMCDPFKPPPLMHTRAKPQPECYIAMGANCVNCKATVCRDGECSFFYKHTYCLSCAKQQIDSFPAEVKVKLRKQLAAVK